ncbi:MAG: dUTP diphosphatase [Patescibacteria group bacterium]|nr:dUTP diphosphatase [Patescibacteria group bacterium]MDD5716092.1 dUTP diphosphatase [Patescibacteria group bacterium]
MEVAIKLLKTNARVPASSREGDAGLDLFCCEGGEIPPCERVRVDLGFALELPPGTVALIWDRSGMASKHGIHTLAGVIDSTYRGEVSVVLYNTTKTPYEYSAGDRVAQMIVQKHETVSFRQVDALSDTTRGAGGWLSSGK